MYLGKRGCPMDFAGNRRVGDEYDYARVFNRGDGINKTSLGLAGGERGRVTVCIP